MDVSEDAYSQPSARKASMQGGARSKQHYSDRFIPYRAATKWPSNVPLQPSTFSEGFYGHGDGQRDDMTRTTYQMLLKAELLGETASDPLLMGRTASLGIEPQPSNLFRFRAPRGVLRPAESAYSLSPLGLDSQRLLMSPRKEPRKIAKAPFKVLDAPELQDDFYLNLLDWSQQNVLCVGLGASVYLWSACTSQVTKLTDLADADDSVTSVRWLKRSSTLAIGTRRGAVHLWDAAKCKKIRTFSGHASRVGCLAGSLTLLSSGSRDRTILHRDARSSAPFVAKLEGHRQEVCGLQWSPDDHHLASGGNDNKLLVWTPGYTTPSQRYTEHNAAIKAIAWSPHQHGLLASGGGTADQCIRFWNTLTGQPLQCVSAGSQVCNIAWSKTSNELVSTHGYSQNQIVVWKYPSMTQTAVLTGHACRVLYLAMAPDGQTIVTGAGDETLRFWNVFSKARGHKGSKSALRLFSHIR